MIHALLAKQLNAKVPFETAYGRAYMEHRLTIDGWDGTTWAKHKTPTGIVGVMLDVLEEMDGGTMWMVDLIDIPNAARAIERLKSSGMVFKTGFERGMGDKLQVNNDLADPFIRQHTVQGSLF